MASPPGRATSAFPSLATRGPKTFIDARSFLTGPAGDDRGLECLQLTFLPIVVQPTSLQFHPFPMLGTNTELNGLFYLYTSYPRSVTQPHQRPIVLDMLDIKLVFQSPLSLAILNQKDYHRHGIDF